MRLSKKLECGLPARLYKHLQARMPAFQYHFLDNLIFLVKTKKYFSINVLFLKYILPSSNGVPLRYNLRFRVLSSPRQ